jgi:RNA polymerase sigma factor (sigma-70 family)
MTPRGGAAQGVFPHTGAGEVPVASLGPRAFTVVNAELVKLFRCCRQLQAVGNQEHAEAADAATIARSVDEAAVFAEVFERHFSLVYRFLSLRAGEQWAGDLAAETFVVAFRRRSDYDVTRPDARPWPLGIAANLARQQHRSERRRRDTLLRLAHERPVESEDDALAGMDASTNSDELRAALAELAPEERDLLLLFGCVDLSYGEIADALSLPIGTVRSRIHRLRHKLRGRLSLPAQEVRG